MKTAKEVAEIYKKYPEVSIIITHLIGETFNEYAEVYGEEKLSEALNVLRILAQIWECLEEEIDKLK